VFPALEQVKAQAGLLVLNGAGRPTPAVLEGAAAKLATRTVRGTVMRKVFGVVAAAAIAAALSACGSSGPTVTGCESAITQAASDGQIQSESASQLENSPNLRGPCNGLNTTQQHQLEAWATKTGDGQHD
jgi:predicted small lipoprotein YifL